MNELLTPTDGRQGDRDVLDQDEAGRTTNRAHGQRLLTHFDSAPSTSLRLLFSTKRSLPGAGKSLDHPPDNYILRLFRKERQAKFVLIYVRSKIRNRSKLASLALFAQEVVGLAIGGVQQAMANASLGDLALPPKLTFGRFDVSSQAPVVEKIRNSFVVATIFQTGQGFGESEWTQSFPAFSEVWRHRLPSGGRRLRNFFVAGSARIRW